MRRPALWQLSVITTAEAEEPVAALLSTLFGQPPCVATDVQKNLTRVSLYFATKPDWSAKQRNLLRQGLNGIRGSGLALGSARCRLERVKNEDWKESWKRHFKPIRIGSRLVIKPTWSRTRPRPHEAMVILDPGLSFGTGHHPTTGFCLEQAVHWQAAGQSLSFLDIGTGSGILAIAAARLGYAPVVAFDVDRDAVRIAKANARLNRVSSAIQFRVRDLSRIPGRARVKYSLICANLISTILVCEKQKLLTRLAPSGHLVLAGILAAEFAMIQNVYEGAGLRLVISRREKEWRSGCFAWAHNPP